ncbi:MAG: VPLPA-CTERM sorting domain-containing protein [Pseudomonadota bacterium]
MITKYLSAGLAAASAGLFATASHALVIDTYDTEQTVQHVNGVGEDQENEVFAPEALGDYRHLYAENKTGTDDGTLLSVNGGVLNFSNSNVSAGIGYITYDGAGGFDGPGGAPVQFGTKLADFLVGPEPFMDFNVDSYEANLDVQIRVWDTTGNVMFYTEILPPAGAFEPALPLDDFSLESGGSFDWSSVGAVQFRVESEVTTGGYDGSISDVTVNAIPLPASALALVGGLGGIAALRRRRKS